MNPAWYSSSASFMICSGETRMARFSRFCISSVLRGCGGHFLLSVPPSRVTTASPAPRTAVNSALARCSSNSLSLDHSNSAMDASRPLPTVWLSLIFQKFSGTCASMSHLRWTMNPSVGNWHGP